MYRINELLKLDRKIYHSNDLAILWEITNKNTLYTTIKRYIKKGVLIPVFKGLYTTIPTTQLDPLVLGTAIIHRYTYLSTESVLATHGVISQITYNYTFISSLSKKVTIEDRTFLFRRLNPKFLNNPLGIEKRGDVYVATLERAVSDMLYFNPKYTFDVKKQIDWKKVKQIQKEVGYV
jgi:predicted transcriptional regulator of viral defense system